MRKANNNLLYILLGFVLVDMALVFCLYKTFRAAQSHKYVQITDSITDPRGLTSVVFIQDGKEWGLDFLTPKELDSLRHQPYYSK